MNVKNIFSLISLGFACTVFYGVLGWGALFSNIEASKYFLIPAGIVCMVAIPLTWYHLYKSYLLGKNRDNTLSN
jgi:hypothetical protein